MGYHRYRAFCIGVIVTSISWCVIIVIYSTHLESLAKLERGEQRQQMRAFGPVVDHPANIPFPDVPHAPSDDKAAAASLKQKRVKVHGHYHLVDDQENQIQPADAPPASADRGEEDRPNYRRFEDHGAAGGGDPARNLDMHPDERRAVELKNYLAKKGQHDKQLGGGVGPGPAMAGIKQLGNKSPENDENRVDIDDNDHQPDDDPDDQDYEQEGDYGQHDKDKDAVGPAQGAAPPMEEDQKKGGRHDTAAAAGRAAQPAAAVTATGVAIIDQGFVDKAHANAQVPMPQEAPLDNPVHLGAVHGEEDEQKRKYGMDKFAFNVLISDRIGERRKLKDVRHALCKSQVYDSGLPRASIIICYYNEAPSALIRMINSILDHTPRALIAEILLVDDISDPGVTEPTLSEYAEAHWPAELVKRIRTNKREGLIRAKVFGSHKAVGEVLVFLDSHCEVMPVWLEPLLHRVKQNRTNVVCPIIDIIDPDTFRYDAAPVCMGGFDWSLQFKWDYPPASYFQSEQDYIKPLLAPTMAGGLFAIDKSYFRQMGEYDTGMDIWGGENLEISFRIWTCGGRVEIMPCSRIGHIFRRRRPYSDPYGRDTTSKNLVRVARVWLDEYQEKFFHKNAHLKEFPYGDISSRLALRKQLQCKPFSWYLKNIYPKGLETSKERRQKEQALRGAKAVDRIMRRLTIHLVPSEPAGDDPANAQCLGTYRSEMDVKKARVVLLPCKPSSREAGGKHPVNPNQVWHLSEAQELKLGAVLCLEAAKGVRVMKCDRQGAYQEWKLTNYAASQGIESAQEGKGGGLHLFNPALGQCLHAQPTDDDQNPFFIMMQPCADDPNQLWRYVDF